MSRVTTALQRDLLQRLAKFLCRVSLHTSAHRSFSRNEDLRRGVYELQAPSC